MYTWKGAFAPFRKHHHGPEEDHVELMGERGGWVVDDEDVLHVHFRMQRSKPDPHSYKVKLQLQPYQLVGLDDDMVKHIIIEQLNLPQDTRIWLDDTDFWDDEVGDDDE